MTDQLQTNKKHLEDLIMSKELSIKTVVDEISNLRTEYEKTVMQLFHHALSHPIELKELLSKYERWESADFRTIGYWTDIEMIHEYDSRIMYVGTQEIKLLNKKERNMLATGCKDYDVKIGNSAYRGHIKFTDEELNLLAGYGLGVRHGTRRGGN